MLRVTIETDNAAFGPTGYERGAELARILREVADRLARGGAFVDTFAVLDINGNKVGKVEVTE